MERTGRGGRGREERASVRVSAQEEFSDHDLRKRMRARSEKRWKKISGIDVDLVL